MKMGLSRFSYWLDQVDKLMETAADQENPALWLFENNARTPFFMLEALARLYGELHNGKKFDKIREQCKLIEDGLGQIDYYHSLQEAFAGNNNIPPDCMQYFAVQLEKQAMLVNVVLEEEGWLTKDHRRIGKITEKLKEAGWMKPVKEAKAFAKVYRVSIESIIKFASKNKYRFDNIEEDVHELRRKLRWLSIYPQALQGVVQYDESTSATDLLKKYLTEEIINSPYNKLPAPAENTAFLMLDKNHFLALSWFIDKLGKLKDEGLLLTGLAEALHETTGCGEKKAERWIYKLLDSDQRQMEQILEEAGALSKTFFKEKNLQHLLAERKKEKEGKEGKEETEGREEKKGKEEKKEKKEKKGKGE